MPASTLILDRSDAMRDLLTRIVSPLGLAVRHARIGESLGPVLAAPPCDLVLADFGGGEAAVLDALGALRAHSAASAILAVVEPAGATRAVEAMGSCLDDYLLAPPVPGDLLARCRRVLAGRDLHRRLDLLQVELNRRYGAHRIVCRSSAMEAVYDRVLQLAPTRTTVLVTGESGAGKELVARSLHYNSGRRDHPFVAVNCGALAESLIENELFGHERGAYTGAVHAAPGRFEIASGGTLFLDEVGSMGLPAQARLLRVLEEGEVTRVGGTKPVAIDVRLIAATNTDLDEQVRSGGFRKDLLYRLRVASIHVPPLRQRRDDVPVLARAFLRQACEENGLAVKDVAPETVQVLLAHDWPGNVRELKNLVESLAVTVQEPVLRPDHVPASIGLRAPAAAPAPTAASRVGMTLAEVLRLHVAETLAHAGGNRTRAARTLGIGLRTLQRRIKAYRLDG